MRRLFREAPGVAFRASEVSWSQNLGKSLQRQANEEVHRNFDRLAAILFSAASTGTVKKIRMILPVLFATSDLQKKPGIFWELELSGEKPR
jgi:hypothetical protein